jgi:acyl carrier protein
VTAESSVRARVVAIVAGELDVTALSDDTPLFEQMGLDSAGTMRLVTGIEDEFEIEVPDADLRRENFASVAVIVSYVSRMVGA